jgi:hypothetical protein
MQVGIDLVVLLVQAVQLALVLQHVIESQVRQFGLRPGVAFQHSLHEARQYPGFCQRGDSGQGAFDLVKHAQEDPVFGHEYFSYLHPGGTMKEDFEVRTESVSSRTTKSAESVASAGG